MKISACSINHLSSPMGFAMERTTFSWKVTDAKGNQQESTKIMVSEDASFERSILDTGWLDQKEQHLELKFSLQPRKRYYWQVSVRSDAGEQAVSEVQFFETGKMDELWQAKWISCEKGTRVPIFEKEISLSAAISRARLYITGLGLYEAWMENGGETVKIGDEYLTPGCNDYASWIQVQTYDITELMRAGGSTLKVMLGNGWYMGRFIPEAASRENIYGSKYQLLAEVHILYENGQEEIIGTDESWQVTRGTITTNNIYDGEERDDTLPAAHPVLATVTEAPKGILTDRYSLPVTAHETFTPALIHTPAGETVLDMGQEFAGIFSLHVPAGKQDTIRLDFGEMLQDGNFYRDNLRTAKAEYRYVPDGTEKTIRPCFTFYGYRYVRVTGFDEITPADFTGIALYSDLPFFGRISTKNEMLNQFVSNVRWGMKSNFLDVPTDCPQRDERMGWTGDAQVFSPTACYLADTWTFYRKYLHDLAQVQKREHGAVPNVIPSFDMPGISAAWGDAAVIMPWNLYQFYGDASILRDQYESMKAWIDYIATVDGEDHGWRRQFHFGDWLALDHPSRDPAQMMGGTDTGFVADVCYLNSLNLLRKTAEVLDETQDVERYRTCYDRQLHAIREVWFTADGRCAIKTQTALLLTLKHGLSTNPDLALDQLLQLLEFSDFKLQTGFVGTPLLCEVLSEYGYGHLAWHLILNEDYPGWLHEVKLGATTVWERWNSLDEEGHFSSTGMNSLNHYAYGAVCEWLFSRGAGFRALEPGFRRALIAPEISKALGEMETSFESAAGQYSIHWQTDGEWTEVDVFVPFGGDAVLRLPGLVEANEVQDSNLPELTENGDCPLNSGCYHVRYRMNKKTSRYSVASPVRDLTGHPEIMKALPALNILRSLPDAFRQVPLQALSAVFPGTVTEESLCQIDQALKMF